jgi:hypothetical protein
MVQLVNPRYQLKLFAETELTIEGLNIEYEVNKDLEMEPNEAIISIWNLNADYRAQIVEAGMVETPVELYLTPGGIDELVLAFRGEIETVNNQTSRDDPGIETRIRCSSQQRNHRAIWVGYG